VRGLGWMLVGVVVGGVAVAGLEVAGAVHLLNEVGRTEATVDGYTLRLIYLPAVAGSEEAVGVSLTRSGVSVAYAPVEVQITANGQTRREVRHTDANGVFIVGFTDASSGTAKVDAQVQLSNGKILRDVAKIAVYPAHRGGCRSCAERT